MRSIRILVLFDGKAGHLSQSQGLAQLIAKRVSVPCDINIVSAKPFIKVLNRPLRLMAQALPRIFAKAVCAFYKMAAIKHRPDVIISFGGNVVALNVALHRYWQAPNLLIGNKYSVAERFIDVHLTSKGKQNSKAIDTGVALCKVDRLVCMELAEPLLQECEKSAYWGLLIGGHGSGYSYLEHDWKTLGAALNTLAQRNNIQWLITDSRRTDPIALERLSEQLTDKSAAKFCRYGEPNQPCIQSLLGASKRIFCTEDSLSMLTEATAMNKPVVSLRPQEFAPPQTHANIVANMNLTGLIERLAIDRMQDYIATDFSPIVSYEEQMTAVFNQINQSGFLDQFVNPPQTDFGLTAQA